MGFLEGVSADFDAAIVGLPRLMSYVKYAQANSLGSVAPSEEPRVTDSVRACSGPADAFNEGHGARVASPADRAADRTHDLGDPARLLQECDGADFRSGVLQLTDRLRGKNDDGR